VPDARGAAEEIATALARLAANAGRKRVDDLLAKSRDAGLSADEKLELQALMGAAAPADKAARRP